MRQQSSKLVRRPDEGMIAGVAAGVAEHYSIDVTLVRIAFVALGIITGGFAVLLYLGAAVVMPRQEDEPGFGSLKHGVDDLVSRGRDFYGETRRAVDARRRNGISDAPVTSATASKQSDLEL
jgi:phage shock protein PspC (stress-responsive transcriptional regulator)